MRTIRITRWRRGAWAVLGPILLSGICACRASMPLSASLGDERIRQATDALVALHAEEPTLHGFAYADSIAPNVVRGRSPADIDLLAARIYYELARKAGAATAPSGDRSTLRAALARPRPVGRQTRAFFDELLDDTKRRAATDLDFRVALQQATQAQAHYWNPAWNTYGCRVDGQLAPISLCRMLVLMGEPYQVFD
jgi:hypothetical protein